MDYKVIRTRSRRLSLKLSADGEIIVRAPWFVPDSEIRNFVEKHADWVEAARSNPMNVQISPERERELRKQARLVITSEVEKYSKIMKLYPTGIRITSARTRFGSCSAKNSLSFTWRLMLYPKAAVEYVVVHELAHIKHKNHGADFLALVKKTLPDYERRKALLK